MWNSIKIITSRISRIYIKLVGAFLFFMILLICGFLYPLIVQNIMDQGVFYKNFSFILKQSGALFTLFIIEQATTLLQSNMFENIKLEFVSKLYSDLFKKLLGLNLLYFKKNSTEIYEAIRIDVEYIVSVIDVTIISVFNYTFRIISGIIGLFYLNYKLAVIILTFIPLKYMIVIYMSKFKKLYTEKYIYNSKDIASWFSDNINGVREIKLWNLIDKKTKIFYQKRCVLSNVEKKMNMLDLYNNSFDVLLNGLITCIIYSIGGSLICQDKLTIGSLVAFLTYSTYVTGPISSVVNLKYFFAKVLPSFDRVQNIFNDKEEEGGENSVKRNEFHDLEMKNISYKYSDGNLLNNINIKIHKGEKIAIVGDNGSGKSTIIQLILRFLYPQSGSILLDGKDVSSYNLNEYREMYSVISQDIYMFNDTIYNNICLDNTLDRKEIEYIIQDTNILETSDLFMDLDRKVGNNGNDISGGEKQKIAMLRALIKKSSIIIADEPTSNLDSEMKEYWKELFFNINREKTIVYVTHDKEMLRYADKIYMIENFTVKEILNIPEGD